MCKILFLQPGYAHYRNKLFRLLSQKYKIRFIYERSFNVYPGEIKANNLDCTFLHSGKIKKWLELLQILIAENPDVVITSISSSLRTFLSYLYCKIYKKKFILWILEWKEPTYNRFSAKYVLGGFRKRLSKKIIIDCSALIVGGKAAYDYAVSLGKNENDIFYALQCSDDLVDRKATEDLSGRSSNSKLTFLYLSRIIEWKGLDILLKAFSKLEKDNKDVALIVGGDGAFRTQCMSLSKKLGINNIEFRGAILPGDLSNIYNESDVFILPSYFFGNSYEAWGLVINEAMGMSLPIITTTAVGAAYDLIEEGNNGFVVKENNVVELYEAMSRLLNMDVDKMGRVSRQIFETKNDYNKMAYGFEQAVNHTMRSKSEGSIQ